MRDYSNIYIDGAWVPSDGDGAIEVVNAATETVMGSIPDGTASDVDKAVAAATAAFESWSATGIPRGGRWGPAPPGGSGSAPLPVHSKW